MSRRKRKLSIIPIEREGNGRAKRPSRAEMERQARIAAEREARKIIGVVLDQPHRRGNTDQRCESALGRFVIAHRLAPELFDAGQEYAAVVRSHRRLLGLPGVLSNGPGLGHRADDPDIAEKIERLRVRSRDAFSAMRSTDAKLTRWLCCDAGPMDDISPDDPIAIRNITWGLHALAVHFGLIPPARGVMA
jgi:hypothetical protein